MKPRASSRYESHCKQKERSERRRWLASFGEVPVRWRAWVRGHHESAFDASPSLWGDRPAARGESRGARGEIHSQNSPGNLPVLTGRLDLFLAKSVHHNRRHEHV